MEKFDQIKDQAYVLSQGFNSVFNQSNQYDMDLVDCTFSYGQSRFKILPIATASEDCVTPSVKVFGPRHPTGLIFPELNRVIETLNLPCEYFEGNQDDLGGATQCFKFAFKLSALVCHEVKGQAFLNVCPKNGTLVWFVILNPINAHARKLLQSIKNSTADSLEAIKWYNKMGF